MKVLLYVFTFRETFYIPCVRTNSIRSHVDIGVLTINEC